MKPDPITLRRHRAFGQEMAAKHFELHPADNYPSRLVLRLMTEAIKGPAADMGMGSKAIVPYARAATVGFLREWRRLKAGGAT